MNAIIDKSARRPIEAITSLHPILSLRCNYRCGFCYQSNFNEDLPELVWRERLLAVYPNITTLVLHGGEPTVAPVFMDFCEFVLPLARKARWSIFTNGYRFSGYWQDLMVKNGGFVNFSLNAASAERYSVVNRCDHFDHVLDNVRLFRKRIRDEGSSTMVDFSFVITSGNILELEDFVRLAARYNAHRVRFFFDLSLMPPADHETLGAVQRAQAACLEYPSLSVWGLEIFEGRLFGKRVAEKYLESYGCTRMFDNLYVGINGDASFCNFLHDRPIGNLITSNLEEIWNSEPALDIRKARIANRFNQCVNAYCGLTDRLNSPVSPMLNHSAGLHAQ